MKKRTLSPLKAGLLQLGVMALATLAATLLPLLAPARNLLLKALLQWCLLPLLGAVTSGVFARSGVTCYLAWLMPPVVLTALPWLLVGYPFAPGVMLLCCLTSMVGAATGEVLRKRSGERR